MPQAVSLIIKISLNNIDTLESGIKTQLLKLQ